MNRPENISESIEYLRTKGFLSVDFHGTPIPIVNRVACMLYDLEAENKRLMDQYEPEKITPIVKHEPFNGGVIE